MDVTTNQPQQAQPAATPPADNMSATTADVAQQGVASQAPATPASTPPTAPAATTPAPTADPNHPSSIFHKVLETLGGGPHVEYSMGDDGKMQAKKVQASSGDLAKTILAGALTGLFSSAGKKGPGAALQAFGAGGQAVQEKSQQADAQNRAQAQQNFQNKQESTMRQAQIADTNSRVILNTMQAEKLQGDALDEYVDHAAPMLASMSDLADAPGLTQAEIMDGLNKGKYHTVNDLFIPDGKTAKLDANGKPVMSKSGMPEMEITYSHVNNGPVPLTQSVYDEAAAAGLPKFTPGTKVSASQKIPASQMMSIQQQVAGINMAQHEVLAVREGMGVKGTLDWKSVISTPGMSAALTKFQGYMHAAGDDPSEALRMMTAEKQGKDGKMVANPDSKFAGLVSQAFGGGDLLRKYHDQLAANTEARKTATNEQAKLDVTNNPANVAAAAAADQVKDQAKVNVENDPTNQAGKARGAGLVAGAEADAKTKAELAATTSSNLTGDDYLATLGTAEAGTIRAWGEGREAVPPRMASSKDGRILLNKLNQAYPGMNEASSKAYFTMKEDFTKGKTSLGINHLNTALNHLGKLYSATTFSAVFPGAAFTSRHLVQPFSSTPTNASQFADYKGKVGDEIESAYKSGALTDMDKRQADEYFNKWTPNTARVQEANLTTLLVGKLKAYQTQWANGRPSKAIPDFPVISEENVATIKRITGEDVSHLSPQAARTSQPVAHTGTVPVGAQTIMRNGKPVGYIANGVRTDF
jgi:hypothetical protein